MSPATTPDSVENSPSGVELPKRVGLIAGGGRFPVIVAQDLRRQGIEVVCAAIRGQADPDLREFCVAFRYLGLGRLNAAMSFFRNHEVREITWAGWIRKAELFRPWRLLSVFPDWRMTRFFFLRVKDHQNQTLLGGLADEFESEGFYLAHSAKFSPQLLATEGVLSRRHPTPAELTDIAFGWHVAKRMAELDVGQSVAVSEKSTLAVESIEGTDKNIVRAGEYYCRGGFTVVKLAKDDHDMRFDVPTVGPDTISTMVAAGGAVLAIEAGRTLILDGEETLRLADRHGIVVIALSGPPEILDD